MDDKKGVTCSEYILITLKQANYALTYKDFGTKYAYGTLRNEMSKHIKNRKVLTLPKEWPSRFILPKWAHRLEYYSVQRNDRKVTVGKFDFLSYLESLNWNSFLAIHNLKLKFEVYQLHWLGRGWKYCKNNHSYSRQFALTYPVKVQCFDTGTIVVNIKCSLKPFELDLSGLLALSQLLGEVVAHLHAPCIPNSSSWQVTQWHLNRDSKIIEGGGLDVNLSFRDFFNDAAKFYYKKVVKKYRAEVSQSPKRTIQEIFENILNRYDRFKK